MRERKKKRILAQRRIVYHTGWTSTNETRRNYMIVSLSHAEANLDDATRRRDVHEQEYATETAQDRLTVMFVHAVSS